MQGPHDTRRGAGRDDDRSASHVVIDRPGLSRRSLAILATLLLVVGAGVVLRAATGSERTAAPDSPTTTTTSTTIRPAPTTTTTTTFDVVQGRELSIKPAPLPCSLMARSVVALGDLTFAPAPDALIPGSTSVLSWNDPDLSVDVVPGSDIVVLTTSGGAKEHRRFGRLDPDTGSWDALFDQEGCRVLASIVVEDRPRSNLWMLLEAADGTYLADVSLDDGRLRWSARADWATHLIDAGDEIWAVGDAFRPTPRRMWSGRTELIAVDTRTHEVAPGIMIRAAIIPGGRGELVVVENGRVSRLDPTTGDITDRLGTIDGLYAGDVFTDRAALVDGQLWNVNGYGSNATVTHRPVENFTRASSHDAPCARLLPRWAPIDARPTIGVVAGCGTELRVDSFNLSGWTAAGARFTTHVQYEFDRPVPVVPTLVPDASGFWYVGQIPTPTSPRGGPPSVDARWHLLHVDAPDHGGVLPLG